MTLVDTLADEPIECINPKGIKTSRQDDEFDVLIYATGFDGVTGAFDRIDIRGTNGLRLKDSWPKARAHLSWDVAEGFPNSAMVLGPHTARGNIPQAIEHSVQFQTGMLRFMQEHHYTHVETRPDKVDDWTRPSSRRPRNCSPRRSISADRRELQRRGPETARRVLGYNGNGVISGGRPTRSPEAATRNSFSAKAAIDRRHSPGANVR